MKGSLRFCRLRFMDAARRPPSSFARRPGARPERLPEPRSQTFFPRKFLGAPSIGPEVLLRDLNLKYMPMFGRWFIVVP